MSEERRDREPGRKREPNGNQGGQGRPEPRPENRAEGGRNRDRHGGKGRGSPGPEKRTPETPNHGRGRGPDGRGGQPGGRPPNGGAGGNGAPTVRQGGDAPNGGAAGGRAPGGPSRRFGRRRFGRGGPGPEANGERKETLAIQSKADAPICPLCEKPVFDISTALGADRETGKPAHFDCVLERVTAAETLGPGEKIVYLGSGAFAVVEFRDGKEAAFSVKRRIQWEKEGEKKDWRRALSARFTGT